MQEIFGLIFRSLETVPKWTRNGPKPSSLGCDKGGWGFCTWFMYMREHGTICSSGVVSLFYNIFWLHLADLTTENGTICPFGVFFSPVYCIFYIKI